MTARATTLPRLLPGAWFAAVALSVCLPLSRQSRIVFTDGNDLANHVRHVYEYSLALREGQFPPLVAPEVDGHIRVPVFQYYSGTGYLLPGVATRLGLHPYAALKLSVFLHALAAGLFAFLGCRALGVGPAAAIVAGTAYPLFPFAGCDLYVRGAYTECLALYTAPALFYASLRLVQAGPREAKYARLCLAALAWAYFIPLHPIQTVLCGGLVVVLLTAHAVGDRKTSWRGPAAQLSAVALGAAGAAWFWVPVARDYALLRIAPHTGFLDAGLSSLPILLSLFYRRATGWNWAPQFGLHFALAALTMPMFLRSGRRAIGFLSSLSLLGVLAILRYYRHFPAVAILLSPLQWSYRLLVPAALAGMVCLAFALEAVFERLRTAPARRAVLICVTAYVVGTSPFYFLGQGRTYGMRAAEVTSPAYVAPNTTASYVFRGTDYSRLAITTPGGLLNTGQPISIPADGLETEISLSLRRRGGGGNVEVHIAGSGPRTLIGSERINFTIKPGVGITRGDTSLQFDTSPDLRWEVDDVTFRALADPPDRVCRVPSNTERRSEGGTTSISVIVPAGRCGLYQLPVCYLPTNVVQVNGAPAASRPPSANQSMVIIPLQEGANLIKIRTRPTPAAALASLLTCLVLGAGAGFGLWRARRTGAGATWS